MKRFAIILLAIATALVMALPAAAKKPVNPEPEPEPEPAATYMAEIVMLSTNGVETTCTELDEATGNWVEVPLILTRTDTAGGRVTHFESTGAALRLAIGMAALSDGCHGEVVVPLPEPWSDGYFPLPEYFRITLDGEQVAMLWIFDVTFDENGDFRKDFRMGGPYKTTISKNGKITTDFAEWGHDIDLENGVIVTTGTGTFDFVRYEAGGDPMFADLENGSQEFTLELTLTPIS